MTRLVITGFGPFGTITGENPSSGILEDIDQENLMVVRNVPVSVRGVESLVQELPREEGSVWVHFGVNERAEKFYIEKYAYNEMKFPIPDNDGFFCCGGDPITPDGPHRLETGILIEPLMTAKVSSSDDPGRYICNYLYYRSLEVMGGRSLFIHVPPYSVIPKEEQKKMVENF